MRGQTHLRQLYAAHQEKIATLSEELNQLRAQLASDQALLEALGLYAARLRAGQRSPARAHLYRPHRPLPLPAYVSTASLKPGLP